VTHSSYIGGRNVQHHRREPAKGVGACDDEAQNYAGDGKTWVSRGKLEARVLESFDKFIRAP
jgi:hypothetical protein